MKNIVILIFISGLVFVASEDHPAEEFIEASGITDEAALQCLQETGLTEEELTQIEEATEEEWESPEMDEIAGKFGCFLSCIFSTQGWMIDDKLQASKIHATIDESESLENTSLDFHQIVDDCIEEAKTHNDKCAVALYFMECIVEIMEESEEE